MMSGHPHCHVVFREPTHLQNHVPYITRSLLFQVYNVCSDTFDSYDQHYGRGLVKDTIKDGMWVFGCVFIS